MKIVVVGIANLQTALPVDGFPVPFEPRRSVTNQIRHTVGGVGFNQARTLSALGHMVALASPLGEDYPAAMFDAEAYRYTISTHLCQRVLPRTPRSVVLYDEAGHRQANVDLGGALDYVFQPEQLAPDLFRAKLVILGNVPMVLPLVAPLRARGKALAVDIQDVRGADNPYDEPFLQADYLNMSNDRVRGREREVLLAFREKSPARALMMTLGADGALILTRDLAEPVHVRAEAPAPNPTNTAGAGDLAFAVFLHRLLKIKDDPIEAARVAVEASNAYVASDAPHGAVEPEELLKILDVEPRSASAPSSAEIPWNSYAVDV